MNPSDLLTEGISLMLFGMGFVFLFLTSLVLVTSLMSKTINRYFQEPFLASSSSVANYPTNNPAEDEELVAVIGAAIRMHRDRLAAHKRIIKKK